MHDTLALYFFFMKCIVSSTRPRVFYLCTSSIIVICGFLKCSHFLITHEFVIFAVFAGCQGQHQNLVNRVILHSHINVVKKWREQSVSQPGVNEAILLGHQIFMNRNAAFLGNRHIITIWNKIIYNEIRYHHRSNDSYKQTDTDTRCTVVLPSPTSPPNNTTFTPNPGAAFEPMVASP